MMRRAIAVLVLATAMLAGPLVHAAGWATPGVGIKARSMGGAFRGIADDWSAASYNPAGLAFLKSSQLNLSLGTYDPRAAYTPNISATSFDGAEHRDIGFNAANGLEHYPTDEVWPMPSVAGFAAPPEWNGFVAGAAITFPYDVNYAWDLYRAPNNYNSDYQFTEQNYRTDMDVLDIHPTFAKRLSENFSVGFGINMTNGDVVFRRPIFVANELGMDYNEYPFNQFIGDFRLEGNGFAFGANAGIMWKASDNLTIGVSGQSPITIPISGYAELNMAWPTDDQRDNGIVINGADTIRTKLYFSGNYDPVVQAQNQPYSRSKYDFDLKLPAQLGVGLGWQASDRLMIGLDGVVTFWSAVDSWSIMLNDGGLSVGTSDLTQLVVPFDWKDQFRVSGGVEYAYRENLMIRGGAYYEGGASADSTFSPNFPNDGDVVGLAGGFAVTLAGHMELAAAQEIAFYSSRTIESYGGSDGRTVFPGEYSLTRYETILSMTYRF